ncbi:MAG TPA: hypothetical protein VJV78_47695 [Polyangiales bacterium]|nr:hypothetical protein [Polyangiales bacterium]
MVAAALLGGCSEQTDEPKPHRPSKRQQPTEQAGAMAEVPAVKPAEVCDGAKFGSTFEAIQKLIFEARGCTNDMCHGVGAMSGLDLRAGKAYDSLIEVKSGNSPLFRVMPGEPDESFLYNKLRAATMPGSVMVEGSPMPTGTAPLSTDHLEAVRRWIEAGAPREGSIGDSVTGQSGGVAKLLGSCLPQVTPVEIKPLEPPAADEGIQIAMAPFTLSSEKEVDVCFAQYYDYSDVVPDEFQDREKGVFFVNGQRTRQDPHSHHLGIRHSGLGKDKVNDPSFGQWACRSGDSLGKPCDPLDSSACGSGICASEPKNTAACIGFGPAGTMGDIRFGSIATAQTAQYYRAPREHVYETIPIRGILYMNSHAFNLTSQDTKLHAWINLFYAKDRRYPIQTLAVVDRLGIAAGQPPFTKKSYCATWIAPQNSDLYTLGSHTHKRGRNFTVDLADGTRIYTSEIYSDPVEKIFEPPLRFDSADPRERTLTYCAEFNNGLNEDGVPDTSLVTRLSTMPDRTTCTPVACVKGKIGAPCQGASDNAACDSSPGGGDGSCDACTITAGQTTENEMFALSPSIVKR